MWSTYIFRAIVAPISYNKVTQAIKCTPHLCARDAYRPFFQAFPAQNRAIELRQ